MGLASSELSNWRKDKKAKRRKINSTRTLISLENERNLELLKDFWYKLNKSEEMKKVKMIQRFLLPIDWLKCQYHVGMILCGENRLHYLQ